MHILYDRQYIIHIKNVFHIFFNNVKQLDEKVINKRKKNFKN